MTYAKIRDLVASKIKPGEEITLKWTDKFGKVTQTIKTTVIALYDTYILTEHDGYRECFLNIDVLAHMEG